MHEDIAGTASRRVEMLRKDYLSGLHCLVYFASGHAQCNAPLWEEENWAGGDNVIADLVLIEALAGDFRDGVRHGCTQPSASS